MTDDTEPSAEAQAVIKELFDDWGGLTGAPDEIVFQTSIIEQETALALDRFRAAGVRKGIEQTLQAARKCARFRCPVDDGYPARCPDCGATVVGNDPVRGRCQSDVIRGIKAGVIEAYLRRTPKAEPPHDL